MTPSVFLPATVYEIGNGAVGPIIALTALDLGASPALAGLVLALLGIGQVLGDLPSSSVVNRFGDRRAMIGAAAVAICALLVCRWAPNLTVFAAATTVIGMCNATFYLGRQTYVTQVAPPSMRAVALSTLGGAHRIGLFIGPFVGAIVIGLTSPRAAYLVAVVTAAAAAGLLLVVPDVNPPPAAVPARAADATTIGAMLRTHRRLLFTLGFAIAGVGAVRAARQTVLPLWAHHIGLNAQTTSVVFGIAAAADMLLFYPSGKAMDRYGRLAVAVPSMVILGAMMVVLPLTTGVVSLTVVAVAMSLGNGLGAGIVMTIGADVSPADGRVRFLSMWRVMSDTGAAVGPGILAIVAAVTTLAAGVVAVGAVGVFAAVALHRWVPRYSPYANLAMVRALREGSAPG